MGLGDYFNNWAKDFMVKKTWRFSFNFYKDKKEAEKHTSDMVRKWNDRTSPQRELVQKKDSPDDTKEKG